ncbi:condensation domain-containing protein [Motilimonas sp. E26]|uniref:condensation domain-containing protein n=1 Tax=Motilimonas sp. E26 TaxID=2865674 RepID=UPI001E5B7056|nr:condensation domain-containing protein [Motilimonas sp. E26]MCE0556835.1 hypothetical protein [Motilimonas sp. E26]
MMSHAWQPLTNAQQAYWDEFVRHPDQPLSIVAHCLAISGAVDINKLAQAINQAVAEAQALHLKFQWADSASYPQQMVARHQQPSVEVVDLRDQDNALEQADANMRLDVATPIDLVQDTMTKVQLYLINNEKVLWYLRTHHIAVDGYSMYLIEQRCAHIYQCLLNGTDASQRAFKPFDTYLKEHGDYQQSSRFESDKVYWNHYLDTANLALSNMVAEVTNTTVAERDVTASVSCALVTTAQKLMIGWGDMLTLLCATYLYQHWRGEPERDPLPVWLPYMNRMGNPCANTPGLMVNTIPYLVRLDQNEAIDLFLKRAVTELRNHYRHGRYRVENKQRSSGHYCLSPFINVLPFDPPEFQACSAQQRVIAGGVADGFNVTFRCARQATKLSLKIEAETRLFSPSQLQRHADDLLQYLTKTLQQLE